MPKCAKCGTNAKTVNKANLCDSCRLKAEKAAKDAAQKIAADKKAAEEKTKREEMGKAAEAKQKLMDEKKKKIAEFAVTWRGQVKTVVNQVLAIRNAHPGQDNAINAGNNGALGTTLGGTNNPVVLTVPANTYQITKAEIFAVMNPDNSDSGLFKFRHKHGTKDIMVHCK